MVLKDDKELIDKVIKLGVPYFSSDYLNRYRSTLLKIKSEVFYYYAIISQENNDLSLDSYWATNELFFKCSLKKSGIITLSSVPFQKINYIRETYYNDNSLSVEFFLPGFNVPLVIKSFNNKEGAEMLSELVNYVRTKSIRHVS